MFSTRVRSILLGILAFILLFAPTAVTRPAYAALPYSAPQITLSAPTTVTITSAPGTVGRGYQASVTVKTQPAASCSISVYYKSGRSVAQGLTTKKASASGVVSWSWKVGTRTTPGSWPVVITCGGASARTYVTVP